MRTYIQFFLFALLATVIQLSNSARILALFPFPLKSHFIVFEALLMELANRRHTLTVVTSYPKKNVPTNYHQIDTSSCLHIPEELSTVEFSHSISKNSDALLESLMYLIDSFEEILKCDPMQELLHTTDSYDLLVTEAFISDALLGYAHKFQTPFILFSTLPVTPWSSEIVGNPSNPAYIPFPLNCDPFGKSPSFYARLYNTMLYLKSWYHTTWKWTPRTNELVQTYLGKEIPPVTEIAKNVSLILTFSHFSSNAPWPSIPAVIEVGGLHIKDPAPLPKDIDEFLNTASEGVIYFCLGSITQGKTMPFQKLDAFINAFKQLPQRVIWKWEAPDLPRKPKNVMIKQWMPQRDILAHPNVKLFITHGGALGMNEAIYKGVPMIGIPLEADQFVNLKFIESFGAGEILYYENITTDTILTKIETVLNVTKYTENVKKLSQIHKDRPLAPMETAIYWIEYVIRHKGAGHLQSAAINLTWFQYLLLDVVFISLISIHCFIKEAVTHSVSFCLRVKTYTKLISSALSKTRLNEHYKCQF